MKYRVKITKQPRYQAGGEQEGQQQIMQVIQAFAQMQGVDPKLIMQKLQQMQPEQQKQVIQQMLQSVQQGQQQGFQEEMMEGPEGQNPEEEQMEPQMAYGGQMGYGLDLGARRLWMNQDSDEGSQVTDSLEEVPRDQANIEAEGGETALIPYEKGQGYLHKKIKGNRHTEGGVPLNVPEGTFIYSDTKKMKLGGPVLKMFGKSEKSTKKFTPADLAKQYPIDKYKAIMDDPKSDPIKKRTAELMIQNFEKKLAQLALVQEGKKGYPQGIPQVAQKYYQQMVAASNPQDSDIEGVQEDRVELQEEGQPQAMYGMGFRYGGGLYKAQAGISTGAPYMYNKSDITQDDLLGINQNSDNTQYDPNFPNYDTIASYTANSNNWKKNAPKPKLQTFPLKPIKQNNEKDDMLMDFEEAGIDPNKVSNTSFLTEPITTNAVEDQIDREINQGKLWKMNTPNVNTYSNNLKAPWSTADKMNLANSLYNMATVRKATPFEPTVKLDRAETYYVDPSRALAANAEQMNAARQAASMFAGPQSRYSFNAGQYGKNAADIIGQYAMQNVGVANTAAQQNAAINNQQMQYDAQRVKRLYDAGVLSEQQYQNAMRQARAAALQAFTQGKENAVNTANLSATQSPFYGLTPDRLVYFKYANAQRDMFDPNKMQKNDQYKNLITEYMKDFGVNFEAASKAIADLYGKRIQTTSAT